MKKRITIRGCDDSTYIDMELNELELELVRKICKASKENSGYSCQPTMSIDGVEDEE